MASPRTVHACPPLAAGRLWAGTMATLAPVPRPIERPGSFSLRKIRHHGQVAVDGRGRAGPSHTTGTSLRHIEAKPSPNISPWTGEVIGLSALLAFLVLEFWNPGAVDCVPLSLSHTWWPVSPDLAPFESAHARVQPQRISIGYQPATNCGCLPASTVKLIFV
jgi:hypothetical protein